MIESLKITIYIITSLFAITLNILIYISIDYSKQNKKITRYEKLNNLLNKELQKEKMKKKIKPCSGIYEDRKIEKCYIEFD